VVVSKDAYTFVVYKDKTYINSTGNAGMATAGSGDVLSGLITGLVAQGYSPLKASILGVYIHGASGDFYASTKNQNSLIASDLIENFWKAFSLLKK
jgi:NAD(P)H-hydrate repair Nnr-like enzyme with NAD(P)H-hydrate dehydratase domain